MTLSPAVDRDLRPVPRHVAIIMDGNRRWAAARHLPRQTGYRAGIDAVRRTVRAASAIGVRYLTLFGFSSENWKRPRADVDYLMNLMRFFIRRELKELDENEVRLLILGERAGLPADIVALIDEAEAHTGDNLGLTLCVAFNYGGRQEIAAGTARLIEDAAQGKLDIETADEAALTARLWSGAMPSPDLIIRTSGELRLSNFLLWGAASCDLVFVDRLWPDFAGADLEGAVKTYRERHAAPVPA